MTLRDHSGKSVVFFYFAVVINIVSEISTVLGI